MKLPLRIAVADDELDMRDFFRRMLSRDGYHVVSAAENGRQLVEQCREFKPDLVISDIKMPELNGIDAAAAIWLERPVPVILVSAHYDEASLGQEDQVMAFLNKPFTYAELERTIRLAMKRFGGLHNSQRGDGSAQ